MEVVKFVIDKLNKPPFNKNFNLISFDLLSSEELLQLLSDVLQQIGDQEKIDIHAVDSEQTVMRILNILAILKYKPLLDATLVNTFRQNFVQGDKTTMHQIFEWLLSNIDDLSKRMYLAKFLVKLDVPSDMLGDSDIAILHQQYLHLIEEFKKVHKESVTAKNTKKISILELKSDGITMEKEKEIVSNRIYHIKKKIDSLPNVTAILNSTHSLRRENDRKKETAWQQQEETATIQQCQQRIYRLSQQLQELKKRSVGLSSQALLKKLEEEIYVTSYIAKQKYPRELKQQKKEKEIYENIANSANITKASIDVLESKVQSITQHINQLVENRLSSTATDDKIVLFRQQAAIVARKKDNLAEKYSEIKKQLHDIQEKLQEKQQQLEELIGETGVIIKSNEHFQEYVGKYRTRSSIYKRYRSDLAVLKAESGVLARTIDILRSKANQLGVDLSNLENLENSDSQSDIENKSSETLLSLITQITANISSQKTQLIPLISNVKPLQEEMKQLTSEHEESKRIYDRTSLALNTNLTKLINEVKALEDQHNKATSEINNLTENIQQAKDNLKRATEEFQASVDKNNSKPLVRERLHQNISEEERINRMLKEEQRTVKDGESINIKQKNAWNNLFFLMQVKLKCLQYEKEELNNVMHLEKGAETLVLLE